MATKLDEPKMALFDIAQKIGKPVRVTWKGADDAVREEVVVPFTIVRERPAADPGPGTYRPGQKRRKLFSLVLGCVKKGGGAVNIGCARIVSMVEVDG